jgi:hypothetical protein
VEFLLAQLGCWAATAATPTLLVLHIGRLNGYEGRESDGYRVRRALAH